MNLVNLKRLIISGFILEQNKCILMNRLQKMEMLSMSLDARHYRNNSTVQKRLADILLSWHVVQPHEVILDVGCGDGVITAKLSTMASQGKVLGIDPSEEMITLAKETFPTNDFKNLYFCSGRAEDSHEQKHYSLITALNCLHWVKDLNKAFQQMHDALLPHGKLLALTYPAESPYWALFTEILQQPQWQSWYAKSICSYWLTSEDYQQLIQKIGFKILRMETVSETVTYATQEAFKDYANGWLPCLLDAPSNILADYLDEVAQLMWVKYGDNAAGVTVPYKKLHLYLEKVSA